MRDGPTEGEAWVADRLGALRNDGFSPAAIGRFLRDSGLRAAEIRAARPELAAQSRRWAAAGFALWVAPATVGVEPFRRRLVPGLAWWGSCALMLDWHLGMFETAGGRPRPLGAADAATLLRAWLVPLVSDSPTPAVLMAGAASDVADGVLARRAEPTRAGRDLEGLVDTCFALAALRGLSRRGLLGRGAATAESARLAGGTALALVGWFARAEAPDRRLLRAARSTSALRFAGLLAASSGRRAAGDVLVAAGAAASLALSLATALPALRPQDSSV